MSPEKGTPPRELGQGSVPVREVRVAGFVPGGLADGALTPASLFAASHLEACPHPVHPSSAK